jgi:selenocysteine-specific elongation factor
VDVPGHERFVRTMLAGVGGVDFVMLIVAADESVMPQTREHFDICRLLGLHEGCVVITKIDAADADTRALVAMEVAELVRGSFLERQPVVEVSARNGQGLDALRDVLAAAANQARPRPESGAVRLPIDRVFTMRGFGTVVTGTLVSGTVHQGDELTLVPGAATPKVRGLQVHGRSETTASAGQRTAINLGGVELADVSRGQTLASPDSLSVTRRADVALDLLASVRALKHGARVRVHHGTAEVFGRVSIAGAEVPDVPGGGSALARLRLESPAVLTRGDRVILRAYSPPLTIGAATVIDPAPTTPGVRSGAGLRRLQELATADGRQTLAAMVRERGLRGIPLSDAVARAGLAPVDVPEVVQTLEKAGTVRRAGALLVSTVAMEAVSAKLVTLVKEFHAQQPLSEGLPREEARARLFADVDVAVFEAVMQGLTAARAIVDRERLALPGYKMALPGGEATVAAVEAAYRQGGLTPPEATGVAAATGLAIAVVETATTYLLRQKVLVKLDTLLLHREALEGLKRDMAALKLTGGGGAVRLDVAMFKEQYGITRKFAIPLLEYLDRERVTRRMGDARVLL